MSSEQPRTITLATVDFGDVTLPCPAWCAGHQDHDPETARVDLIHVSPALQCAFLGIEVFTAEIVQSPFATPGGPPRLGGRTPGVSVHPLGRTLDPIDLYGLAGALDRYADQLRDLADRLDTILDRGERR